MFSRRKRTPRSQSQRPQTAPGKPQAPGRPPEFYARQATRTVRSRTFWLMLVMGILVFVILFFQLYHLQITRHKELQTKALDQQTRQTVVSAFRGTIYDRNGSQLAVSVSTEDVVMSPYHMKKQLDDEAERLEKIRLENAQLKKGETPQSEDTTVLWDYDSLATASRTSILLISGSINHIIYWCLNLNKRFFFLFFQYTDYAALFIQLQVLAIWHRIRIGP